MSATPFPHSGIGERRLAYFQGPEAPEAAQTPEAQKETDAQSPDAAAAARKETASKAVGGESLRLTPLTEPGNSEKRVQVERMTDETKTRAEQARQRAQAHAETPPDGTQLTTKQLQDKLKEAESKAKSATESGQKITAYMEYALLHVQLFMRTMADATKGTSFERLFQKPDQANAPAQAPATPELKPDRRERIRKEMREAGEQLSPQGIDKAKARKTDELRRNEDAMKPNEQEAQAQGQITQLEQAKTQLRGKADALLTTTDGNPSENANQRNALTGQIQEIDRRIAEVRTSMDAAKQQRASLTAKNDELKQDIDALDAMKHAYDKASDAVARNLPPDAKRDGATATLELSDARCAITSGADGLTIEFTDRTGSVAKLTLDLHADKHVLVMESSQMDLATLRPLQDVLEPIGQGKYGITLENFQRILAEQTGNAPTKQAAKKGMPPAAPQEQATSQG